MCRYGNPATTSPTEIVVLCFSRSAIQSQVANSRKERPSGRPAQVLRMLSCSHFLYGGLFFPQRGLGSINRLQECKTFGKIMVVPAEKVNVRVDGADIEEALPVEAGTLHELE